MHPEIKENFQEKLRLIVIDLVKILDDNIDAMLREHAAKGLVHSGITIKRTMGFIAEGNHSLYKEIIDHLKSLNIDYYPNIDRDIQLLAESVQNLFKSESLLRLYKSTEHAGKPDLYERMIPDVEAGMASERAKFQNTLNATIVQLKLNKQISPIIKALWGLEALLLLASMFIAGMWFKDPNGNYEPILVGMGLAIPLIAVGIRFGTKKET